MMYTADPDFDKARSLISHLDSHEFQVRQKSFEQLEQMGMMAIEAMREERSKTKSPEVDSKAGNSTLYVSPPM